MQELELLDRFFPDVFDGVKRRTLRWGDGEIAEGFLLFRASRSPDLKTLVWVTSVEKHSFETAAPLYQMTVSELLASMKTHYPAIDGTAELQLVNHLSPKETVAQKGLPNGFTEKLCFSVDDHTQAV